MGAECHPMGNNVYINSVSLTHLAKINCAGENLAFFMVMKLLKACFHRTISAVTDNNGGGFGGIRGWELNHIPLLITK